MGNPNEVTDIVVYGIETDIKSEKELYIGNFGRAEGFLDGAQPNSTLKITTITYGYGHSQKAWLGGKPVAEIANYPYVEDRIMKGTFREWDCSSAFDGEPHVEFECQESSLEWGKTVRISISLY